MGAGLCGSRKGCGSGQQGFAWTGRCGARRCGKGRLGPEGQADATQQPWGQGSLAELLPVARPGVLRPDAARRGVLAGLHRPEGHVLSRGEYSGREEAYEDANMRMKMRVKMRKT